MNTQVFSDAMTEINSKYVEEALTYHRTVKRTQRPVWMQRCIAACLALILCFGSVLVISAEARAAFTGWIIETYETLFVFRYSGEKDITVEAKNYRLTWIPEGYTEWFVDDSTDLILVAYANEAGEMLKFKYIHNPDETDLFIDEENATRVPAMVNENPAVMLIFDSPDIGNAIVWTLPDNTAFYISAFLSEADLVKIAESVQEYTNEAAS